MTNTDSTAHATPRAEVGLLRDLATPFATIYGYMYVERGKLS